MKPLQTLSAVILIAGAIGALYYAATDNEPQGTIVVLLAILAMLAVPHIVKS